MRIRWDWIKKSIVALVALLALALVLDFLSGCGHRASSMVERPAQPPVIVAAPATTGTMAAVLGGDPTLRDLRAERDRLNAAIVTRERELTEARRERELAPLHALLTWGSWVGGVLALAGAVLVCLSWTPWLAWLPGGRATAAGIAGTGVAVIVAAWACQRLLALAWLPWAVLILGAVAAGLFVLRLAIRHAASYGDSIERALIGEIVGLRAGVTDDLPKAVTETKAESQANQLRAGVHGLIQWARGKRKAG